MSFKNTIRFLALGMLALVIQGCEIYSLQPYYLNKDAVFDKELLGRWIEKSEKTPQEFVFQDADPSQEEGAKRYLVTMTDPGKSEAGAKKYSVVLFKAFDALFADVMPDPAELKDRSLVYPAHLLMKVSRAKNEVRFSYINDDWLDGIGERNNFKGRYFGADFRMVNGHPLFVCGTLKLQKFLEQAAKSPEAWSRKYQIVLTKK